MIMFTLSIAGSLAIFGIAGGLLLLHRAAKEQPGGLIRAAAWVLLAGSLATGACTLYYGIRYQVQGAFTTAMPMHGTMMMQGSTMQMPGDMMPGGMMPGGAMPGGMMPGGQRPPDTTAGGHATHDTARGGQ